MFSSLACSSLEFNFTLWSKSHPSSTLLLFDLVLIFLFHLGFQDLPRRDESGPRDEADPQRLRVRVVSFLVSDSLEALELF